MRWYTAAPAVALASGAATLGYAGLYERTRWTLRRFDVPVLAPGSAPLRLLHVSDIHMTAGQRSKQEWLAGLAGLRPRPRDRHRRQPGRLRTPSRRRCGRWTGCSTSPARS